MDTISREDLNDLLQEADPATVLRLAEQVRKQATVRILQHPIQETLMVQVNDPITHGRFYSGEVLATSSVAQVNGTNGWAMVMDDNPELSLSMAILDGAWGDGCRKKQIRELALQAKKARFLRQQRQQAEVAATAVKFDLM
ncbi:MAG TPA: hypothetical protein ENK89_01485 [Desulfobulbaceae bacterium]|nr:hypothetical protein [Desulfobulbaceae bacterium]